ncbi:MAG TPA: glycosyl hydrolase [Longimicrobium sp.]|jgi:endoglucanase
MRSIRSVRAALLLTLATVVMSACGKDLPTSATGESPASPATPAPSDRPFFSGAYLGDAASTPERIAGAIRDFGTMTGKQPALVKTFHDLTCDFSATGWCGRLLREVISTGATSYVALDVRWTGGPRTGVLGPIVAGQADAELARVARQIAALDRVVLVEPAWEMNGNWDYAWQGAANGGDRTAPARYAQAWRHIVDVFRREGASNVRWVFNPNVGNPLTLSATGASHWNWYVNYYPGDSYVDYVGAHGFNAPRLWGGDWQSPAAMFDGPAADHMLSDLAARYPNKPILIGEFASDEGSGDAKARWIRDAYATLRSHPNVVGAVWFNMNKETDWRIDSTPASLAAFRDAMSAGAIKVAFR